MDHILAPLYWKKSAQTVAIELLFLLSILFHNLQAAINFLLGNAYVQMKW